MPIHRTSVTRLTLFAGLKTGIVLGRLIVDWEEHVPLRQFVDFVYF
jgi:hypothetical protein